MFCSAFWKQRISLSQFIRNHINAWLSLSQVVADGNIIFRTIFKNISQVVADENGVLDTIFEKIHKKLKNNEKKS